MRRNQQIFRRHQKGMGIQMYKNEREQEIIKLLSEQRYMTVKQLSMLLYASESSTRRDLTSLETKGLVKRSYGGVELVNNNSRVVPFSTRVHYNIAAKKAMAKKAVSLIEDGQIVFMDQSSSTLFVASEMIDKKNVTVVTNNVEILTMLAHSDLKVYSSGGYLSHATRNCLLGEDAHKIFQSVHADLLFFSAKALSPDGVIYDCTREEVNIRQTMMDHAEKKIFLCDSGKFDKYSGYRQCALSEVDEIISEADSVEKFRPYLKQ